MKIAPESVAQVPHSGRWPLKQMQKALIATVSRTLIFLNRAMQKRNFESQLGDNAHIIIDRA